MDIIQTPPKKKRRNMGQYTGFHDWLTCRMNTIWPYMDRYERQLQLARMARIDPDKLRQVIERKIKPTEAEFKRLIIATGFHWEQVKDLIWNPTEEPFWKQKSAPECGN